MSSSDLPESVAGNIANWTRTNAEYTDSDAAEAWTANEIAWGVFGVREEDLGSPLGDVNERDVVELGCGTAYFSARLAKHGARPVGVDPTPAQLATARRMQAETGIEFPLVEAAAERVPLPDASFDLAFSEYGASLWADPKLWIPEAARLLRPGGRLAFLTNSVLAYLCFPDDPAQPADDHLHRPQAGIYRMNWPGEDGTEYHLSHGDWIDLLHDTGFEVERLVEVFAPPNAVDHGYYVTVTAEWAQKWPSEDLWVARKASARRRRRDTHTEIETISNDDNAPSARG
ncbi:MAG: class I SAM-dependent methyltransferase [Actinobacteria bacterium]|nr:MAG: class I SAM-dependent methyltransferase [Actinomycetota bacterium]